MNHEARYQQRSSITDRLSYLLLHAPDFPKEDETTLEKEKAAVLADLDEYERRFPRAKDHPRYPVFRSELQAAFSAFEARNEKEGCRLIEVASHRFRETFRKAPTRPDFIADPSGIVKL